MGADCSISSQETNLYAHKTRNNAKRPNSVKGIFANPVRTGGSNSRVTGELAAGNHSGAGGGKDRFEKRYRLTGFCESHTRFGSGSKNANFQHPHAHKRAERNIYHNGRIRLDSFCLCSPMMPTNREGEKILEREKNSLREGWLWLLALYF